MDALMQAHIETLDAVGIDPNRGWDRDTPCREQFDCIGNCTTCQLMDADGGVYIDCGCVAAGRPGLDVRGDVCPFCCGEARHWMPF